MGDGKVASGSDRSMSHSYKTTGTYNITLTLQGEDSNQTTTINRKIYVTDMDSPFAVIKFSNSSNSVTLEKGVCNGKDAYVLKRGEMTSVTGAESVNVDGNTSNLDYTWKYM